MSRFIRQTLIRPDALAISVDLSRIKTPHSLMQRMQEAFALPAYFNSGGIAAVERGKGKQGRHVVSYEKRPTKRRYSTRKARRLPESDGLAHSAQLKR